MDISLEQFIASDRPKSIIKTFKIAGSLMILSGLFSVLTLSLTLGLIMQIVGIIVFMMGTRSYVDYEYEFYDGNIDISKIYACSKRKIVAKIKRENVVNVYQDITKQSKSGKRYFNSNLDGLKIYTFEMKDSKKIELALDKKIEHMVKILYKQQII